ncbi:hypothetical protein Tsubulata_049907 [Turnera subulata]|uniref:SHSP domain-containing protein n=1 Tax=Turnera subulata TaxID=218843 RepID=A0A9Q0JBL1_9ROSI|nr:hypothetical protein Tsubulata_049907 [Turnera subulata]
MALSKPTTTLLSRLLRSTQPLYSSSRCARSFRATAVSASSSKDPADAGDSPDATVQTADDGDDLEATMKSTYKTFQDLANLLQARYPDVKAFDLSFSPTEDYEAMTDYAGKWLRQLRQKIKNDEPELAAKLSDVLYWHPFQVKGDECPYEVRIDEDNWYVRVDIPGIGSKDVKVQFQDNTLYFSAEERDKGDGARAYSSTFDIPQGEYQTDKISAIVKNGVLEIKIPKIKV